MGFTVRPPTQESEIFNPAYYANGSDVLSLEMADMLYLSRSDYRLSYLSGLTLGQAAPMSALVVDSNRNIGGIASLSCGSLTVDGVSADLSKVSLLSIAINGNAEANKALITDSANGLYGLKSLLIDGQYGKSLVVRQDTTTSSASLALQGYYTAEIGMRQSAATNPNQFYIKLGLTESLTADINGNFAIGTQPNTSYKLTINGALNATSYYLNGSSVDLSKIGLLSIASNGTAEASKALITDSANGLYGLKSLLIDGQYAKSLVVRQDTTTSAASLALQGYYIAEIGMRQSAATNPNQFYIKLGITESLTADINGNFAIGTQPNTSYKLTINGALNATSYYLNGSSVDLSKISYLSLATNGTAEASKALITDSSRGITGIYSLTVKGSGYAKGLVVQNDTMSSAASMNFVSYYQWEQGVRGNTSSTTPNCAFWRFANADRLVMDGSGQIAIGTTPQSGYLLYVNGSLYGSNIYGTISTADQPNITSIGALGSLTVNNDISCGSLTVNGVSITGSAAAPSKVFSTDGASYLSGTSRIEPYNLVLVSPSDVAGTSAGLCFYNDSSGGNGFTQSDYTPSVALVSSRIGAGYGTSDFIIYTRTGSAAADALGERMRISQGGNVSFGGTAGAQNINLLKGTSCGFRIGAAESSKDCFTLQYVHSASGADNNSLTIDTYGTSGTVWIKANKQVGICATSAANIAAELHVFGWIRGTQLIYITANSSSNASFVGNWSSSNYWGIGSDATTGAIRFGVCSITGVWSAYVPVRAASFTSASDQRLKTDIVDCPYGLETVMKMKPRRFKMIQEGTDHVGFIAQEMAELVPEAVSGEECPNDTLNEQGFPVDPMGIDLASLTSVLCKAIQEQQKKIEALEERLNTLVGS